jgi:meiotically up-regulated gene 157 (Mug157) protein
VGGCYAGRLGSVHTPAPWPLGDVQDLIIARSLRDRERERRAWDHLARAARWDGALPEASDPDLGEVASRHWFAWPNAALACVALGVFDTPY